MKPNTQQDFYIPRSRHQFSLHVKNLKNLLFEKSNSILYTFSNSTRLLPLSSNLLMLIHCLGPATCFLKQFKLECSARHAHIAYALNILTLFFTILYVGKGIYSPHDSCLDSSTIHIMDSSTSCDGCKTNNNST